MKHRGRHRRRRRGRALRAFLAGTALALTGAATLISASQATVTDDPGALRSLAATGAEAGAARLAEEPVPRAALDRLASAMGRPLGVGEVLADADHTLRGADDCAPGERGALPEAPAATRAYCWDAEDTRGWHAGAVTTSGDASDDGRWGAHQVILAGWSTVGDETEPDGTSDAGSTTTEAGGTTDEAGASGAAEAGDAVVPDGAPGPGGRDGGGRLARVAFVDADDPERLSYTWVLLVVPVEGGRDYRALESRVAGMVWFRDRLLVTADEGDRTALYVYDVNRIHRATAPGDAVGRVPGGWSAHHARFVLPAVGTYRPAGGPGTPSTASVSLDRSTTPPSLVAAERTTPDGDGRARLWRYAFSAVPERSGPLVTDAAGRAVPDEVYETKATGVRGVLARDGAWYVTRAAAPGHEHGTLWRQDGAGARSPTCGSGVHRCWSGLTRSLSYWPRTGEVWAQSGRTLFALELADIDRSAE
ncbi:hypothetical protein [Streptomyces sp. bgisy153]|uniref:hypothetical protein n=1 Tax=Streptomyces sp. bgisy153 TaxID=3413793 RepID=UPI003D7279F7